MLSPKVAPTADALPEVNIEELQKALATGKEVTLDAQGKVVVKDKRETYSAPAVKVVENEKNELLTSRKIKNFTKYRRKFKCCDVGTWCNFRNIWTCDGT